MAKGFFTVNGVQYFDYDVLVMGQQVHETANFVIDRETRNAYHNGSLKLFSNFTPNKDDEVNVIPKCPFAIDDIRKNYKIKRGYDTGVCNIFPTGLNWTHHSRWNYICIVPSQKVAIVKGDWGSSDLKDYKDYVRTFYPYLGDSDFIYSKEQTDVYWYKISDAYVKLFQGTLQKPAIPYTSLKLNSDNELNVDSLLLAYRVCSRELEPGTYATKDQIAAVEIELKALNNYNWREYPGTISLIFGELTHYNQYNIFKWQRKMTVYGEMSNCISKWPKPVRGFIEFKSAEFVSDKDIKMAQEFVRKAINMGDKKFARIEDLAAKLRSINMNLEQFGRVFSATVKIEEKTVENEEQS